MNEITRAQKMEAAKARMAELAAKFLERSDADVRSMQVALSRLASGEGTALGDVRHLAHRMVGTGATLGFESLSEHAHRVEQLADGWLEGETWAVGLMVANTAERASAVLASSVDALAEELHRQHAG